MLIINAHIQPLGSPRISATFDTFNHHRLLQHAKELFGFGNLLLDWLQRMISNHQPLSSPLMCHRDQSLLFAIFITPVGKLINSYGISYHQFDYDTQPSGHLVLRVSPWSLPVRMPWLVGTSGMTCYSTQLKQKHLSWYQITSRKTWSIRRHCSVSNNNAGIFLLRCLHQNEGEWVINILWPEVTLTVYSERYWWLVDSLSSV